MEEQTGLSSTSHAAGGLVPYGAFSFGSCLHALFSLCAHLTCGSEPWSLSMVTRVMLLHISLPAGRSRATDPGVQGFAVFSWDEPTVLWTWTFVPLIPTAWEVQAFCPGSRSVLFPSLLPLSSLLPTSQLYRGHPKL